jgi:hypothetical protein
LRSETVSVLSVGRGKTYPRDMDSEQDPESEIQRLRSQLDEEKTYSKQAAEYGLSILEEFKRVQAKNFELDGELETCKQELEATAQVEKKLESVWIIFDRHNYLLFCRRFQNYRK